MGNQKFVATGRGRKKTLGQSTRNLATPAAGSIRKSSRKSATPAPEPARQTPKLVLNLKPQFSDVDQLAVAPLPEYQSSSTVSQEGSQELPVAVPKKTTRVGRVIKRKVEDDVMAGSELDGLNLEDEFVNQVEDDDRLEKLQAVIRSSPPPFPTVSQPSKRRGRPPKKTYNNLSAQDQASPPAVSFLLPHPFNSVVDPTVYNVLTALQNQVTAQIDLPTLTNASGYEAEESPYTAQFLTHLYLLSHQSRQWHICDIIADTWIRAFQQANKDPKQKCRMWRENRVLLKKALEAATQGRQGVGFDDSAPEYGLRVCDPELDRNVTSFDLDILNELYQHTPKFCGARMLWADAMALCGQKIENMFERWSKQGQAPHPDLTFDIMCTSLRMVGKKLTLKIEESTERAWCKRYHEHGKHGRPCYREMVYEEKLRERGVTGEDVEMDGFVDSPAKRVRFGDERVDMDAEDESEEE